MGCGERTLRRGTARRHGGAVTDRTADRSAYDAWHARVAGDPALDTPWHRLVQDALARTDALDGRRVLEIACGRGEFAEWCVRHGRPRSYVAGDFSYRAVD